MDQRTRKILGQESWLLRTSDVHAAITRQGGHLAPVRFRLGKRWIEPFAIAPWAKEKVSSSTPVILRVMRGDFFCMPFGANEKAFQGEKHPPHGETANKKWRFESINQQNIRLSMSTFLQRGRVDKHIKLVPGQTAIYSQHTLSGMSGRIPVGHHPILAIPDGTVARVSLSAFRFGQVFPGQLENPASGGYSLLKAGARFSSLKRVPQRDGGWLDLSRSPANEGYEDLVLMASDPTNQFAWTALTVPEKKYVWFGLKDPRVLPSTILWMSNGGRHYAPWNGRHRRVIGMEEVAANFHYGLSESVRPNPLNRAGVATCLKLDPHQPIAVNYIMAVAEIPEGFDIVKKIEASPNGKAVRVTSNSGKSISVRLNVSFLATDPVIVHGREGRSATATMEPRTART